jgi:hypothetical protein
MLRKYLFLCFKNIFKINYIFFIFFLQININLMFSDHFDVSISKIIFFFKNIILIFFRVKNTLKNNHNHTYSHVPKTCSTETGRRFQGAAVASTWVRLSRWTCLTYLEPFFPPFANHQSTNYSMEQPAREEATTMAKHSDLSSGKVQCLTMHGSFVDFSNSIVPRNKVLTG